MTTQDCLGPTRAPEMVVRAAALALIARTGCGPAMAHNVILLALAAVHPRTFETFLEHAQVIVHNKKNMNWSISPVISLPRRVGQALDMQVDLRIGTGRRRPV